MQAFNCNGDAWFRKPIKGCSFNHTNPKSFNVKTCLLWNVSGHFIRSFLPPTMKGSCRKFSEALFNNIVFQSKKVNMILLKAIQSRVLIVLLNGESVSGDGDGGAILWWWWWLPLGLQLEVWSGRLLFPASSWPQFFHASSPRGASLDLLCALHHAPRSSTLLLPPLLHSHRLHITTAFV